MTARGSLIGLDLQTGESLWFQDGQPWQLAWSDGQVFAYFQTRDGHAELMAVDTRTGEQVFHVEAGQGLTYSFTMSEDRLVLLTDDALSLWAW